MAIKLIEEEPYGLYIWVTDDGLKITDEEGRVLNIPSKKGDQTRIKALEEAVRYWGIEGGKAVFLSGNRRVTDDEYDHQKARMTMGLIPDPLDFRAMEEEAKYTKKYGS